MHWLIPTAVHMSMLYTTVRSGHTSINHAASQKQAGRPTVFLIALGTEDDTKEKAEPAYHCAAQIHLRG